jgi:hypothetical protein
MSTVFSIAGPHVLGKAISKPFEGIMGKLMGARCGRRLRATEPSSSSWRTLPDLRLSVTQSYIMHESQKTVTNE